MVYPSSNGEGHVIVPTDISGFMFSLERVSWFPFKTIPRFPHAAFDARSKWPATRKPTSKCVSDLNMFGNNGFHVLWSSCGNTVEQLWKNCGENCEKQYSLFGT